MWKKLEIKGFKAFNHLRCDLTIGYHAKLYNLTYNKYTVALTLHGICEIKPLSSAFIRVLDKEFYMNIYYSNHILIINNLLLYGNLKTFWNI